MREIITNVLLGSVSVALLWSFGCIWVKGSHCIQEPNLLILVGETLMLLLILGFAIWNLVKIIERR